MKKIYSVLYLITSLAWFCLCICAVFDAEHNFRIGFIITTFAMGVEKLFDVFWPRRILSE